MTDEVECYDCGSTQATTYCDTCRIDLCGECSVDHSDCSFEEDV